MVSSRKLKRKHSAQMARLCITVSLAPNGDVSVRLPGRRKVLHLTRFDLSVIQALPAPARPLSTSGYGFSSSPSSSTCASESHA